MALFDLLAHYSIFLPEFVKFRFTGGFAVFYKFFPIILPELLFTRKKPVWQHFLHFIQMSNLAQTLKYISSILAKCLRTSFWQDILCTFTARPHVRRRTFTARSPHVRRKFAVRSPYVHRTFAARLPNHT